MVIGLAVGESQRLDTDVRVRLHGVEVDVGAPRASSLGGTEVKHPADTVLASSGDGTAVRVPLHPAKTSETI